jgi:hypothetical protein
MINVIGQLTDQLSFTKVLSNANCLNFIGIYGVSFKVYFGIMRRG